MASVVRDRDAQNNDGTFDCYGHQNGTSFAANRTCSEERWWLLVCGRDMGQRTERAARPL